MAFDPAHGHAALRRGRWSAAEAQYFLTCCTVDRKPGLTRKSVSAAIVACVNQLETESRWKMRTAVIMPDHIHLFISLGKEAALSDVVRLFKGRLAPSLRKEGLSWQRAYFDHRMRPGEDVLPLFLYIFLNPYRSGLVSPGETWPAYLCSPEDWVWFSQLTEADCPLPEWLG